MNRLMSGTTVLAALAAVISCSDPTGDLRGGAAKIVATPKFLEADSGAAPKRVTVQVQDAQGNPLDAPVTVVSPTTAAEIDVAVDDSFRLQHPDPHITAYQITGVSPASVLLIFAAGGVRDTVVVVVPPGGAAATATLSPANAPLGALVTMTAPSNFLFTPQVVLTAVPSGTPLRVVSVAADSTSVTFAPPPGTTDSVLADSVVLTNSPAFGFFSVRSSDTFTAAPLPAVTLTLVNANPAIGAPDTLIAPAGIIFTDTSGVTIPGSGGVVDSISADGSTLYFISGPNASGAVSVDHIAIVGADPAFGTFSFSSGTSLNTAALTSVAANFSTSTPSVNDTVTVTAVGFKFLPGLLTVAFGNDYQAVTSISADSSSFTFRAHKAGASGTISLSGIALDFLTSVPLNNVAATSTVTVGATLSEIPGTDTYATAPPIVIPPTGATSGTIDTGIFFASGCDGVLGGPCRLYSFTLTSTRTFGISATWNNTTDLGIYFFDTGQNVVGTGACDAHGNGAGGQPEACSQTLPAGDYFMVVDTFSPFYPPPDDVDPTLVTVNITGQ